MASNKPQLMKCTVKIPLRFRVAVISRRGREGYLYFATQDAALRRYAFELANGYASSLCEKVTAESRTARSYTWHQIRPAQP